MIGLIKKVDKPKDSFLTFLENEPTISEQEAQTWEQNIKQGSCFSRPPPQPIADAVREIIENEDVEIFVPVGVEATTFIPMRKEMCDKDFENKVIETFGI